MKYLRLLFLALLCTLLAFSGFASTHQVVLKMWKNNPHAELRSLNIYYHSGQQQFIYLYKLTNGTNGSIAVDEIDFSRQTALYGYRVYYAFMNPDNGSLLFNIYIYPSSATGDVSSNIAKQAASQAVGNNVFKCLKDLNALKNRRVNFIQNSVSTTIDCRYY